MHGANTGRRVFIMYNRILYKLSNEIFIKMFLTYLYIDWTGKIFVVGSEFDMLALNY